MFFFEWKLLPSSHCFPCFFLGCVCFTDASQCHSWRGCQWFSVQLFEKWWPSPGIEHAYQEQLPPFCRHGNSAWGLPQCPKDRKAPPYSCRIWTCQGCGWSLPAQCRWKYPCVTGEATGITHLYSISLHNLHLHNWHNCPLFTQPLPPLPFIQINQATHDQALVLQNALQNIPNPASECMLRNVAIRLAQQISDEVTETISLTKTFFYSLQMSKKW